MHKQMDVTGWSRFWLARFAFVRSLANFWNSLAQRLAWPYLELIIRLWVAKLFFFFGVQQLMHWTAALQIVDVENPFPQLAPIISACLITGANLICAMLLVLGFMTRYASLPLLILAAITQFRFEPFDTQLFWMALFGWYVIHGAGPISLDHLLRRGLADSAIPLIPGAIRFSKWLKSYGTPWYLSGLRLWLGAALLIASADARLSLGASSERWLPLDVAMRLPMVAALVGGIALILGVGTRYAALLLLLGLFGSSVVDPRLTDSIYLLMLLAILVVHGGGVLAIDALAKRWHSRLFSVPSSSELASRNWPRVVIVGAGFGGLRCAQALKGANVAVTLIDRNNFHLFQPLLYQVATAALSPGDIAMATRQIFRDAPATRLLLSTVTGIDTKKRLVLTERREIPYDYLVLATGATHSYFGKDEWARYAPGLKHVEDALEVRRRILTAFERAEESVNETEKAALLTFLIVGGGPTGVELAGAIAELARFGLNQDFRTFDPANARIILVQAGARLLPSFPVRLSGIAQRALEKLGVEIRLASRVDHIDEQGVGLDGERIEARTVLWAAGVAASPAATWLKAPSDRAGRILVGEDLRVPGMTNVFAVGDTVTSNAWNGQPVPGLAPAAKQGGAYVAKQIRALVDACAPIPAFRYRHLGSLATIGRKAAVADFGAFNLWGAPAWWLWGVVHLGFMLGVRNRIATLLNWFWSYLKFGGGIRLITGDKT
ncbi:MAG: FAD-dependent oxidoreductase [Steroidobacteraceae bacterium]